MTIVERIQRHAKLTWSSFVVPETPPFLILFINSICNQKCEHCFYWKNLNRRDDLTFEEMVKLSESLGRIENLNLSGGEPFLRAEFGEICRQFIRRNQVRQIYVPTNGYFTDRTIPQLEQALREPGLELFGVELSLDGTQPFHDKFRGSPGSFERSMKTYDALAQLQKRDPRLRIHAISTATAVNMEEIESLTRYLYERCPAMDHHNLAILRGDRKNPTLEGPTLERYRRLWETVRDIWRPRELDRFGSSVEPMLQAAKMRTAEARAQVVPCRAGILTGVVYSNGDVSVCEHHPPIGNIRERSFGEIWRSDEANRLRESIARKECWCTNEIFLWPSIVYHPVELVKARFAGGTWES